MNPKIELKLKLVEMFGKGTFGLNMDCMPLVKEAYDFVADGVDFDKDFTQKSTEISEETAQELSERMAALVDATKDVNGLLDKEKTISNSPSVVDDLHEISLKDGVYLGYKDGHFEMFNGYNNCDNVEFVAFKFGKVSLKVWSKDINDVKMTTDTNEPCDYITSYSVAAHDFDGENHTKNLLAHGLKCDCECFKHGWYIPAIGELYVMFLMKDEINKALEYTSRELIRDKWYWSSTESSAAYAWYLRFFTGYFYDDAKTSGRSVRPVSAFRP